MKKSFSARATPRKIILDDDAEDSSDPHNSGMLNMFQSNDEADLTVDLSSRSPLTALSF
jgi:hypothetical protein